MKTRITSTVAGLYCSSVFGVQTVFAAESAHGGGHGAANSHGGGHAESSVGLPQLDVSTYPSQLFWLAITFFILYTFFSSKTLPEISGVLENRQEHIKNELDQAEKMKKETEAVQKAYEDNLEKARIDASSAMTDMQEEIKKESEKAHQDFLARSEKDIEKREKELAKMKLDIMEDMNTIAAEVASEAAQKIVGIDTDIEQAKTVVKSLHGKAARAA